MVMLNVDDLERQYRDAVRNLTPAQVVRIESGEKCETPVMQYAQQCFNSLKEVPEGFDRV